MGSLRDLMRDEETLELRMLYQLPEVTQEVKKRKLISAVTYLAKKICKSPLKEHKILIKDGGLYPGLVSLIRANLLLNRIASDYSFIEGYSHLILWVKPDSMFTDENFGVEGEQPGKILRIEQIAQGFEGTVIELKNAEKEG